MMRLKDHRVTLRGQGNGPIDAFLKALNLGIRVHHYEERSLHQGSDASAIAYVEIAGGWMDGSVYGVGIHSNIVTASLMAVLSAVNRALQQVDAKTQASLLDNIRSASTEIAVALPSIAE